jgi:hypothetical protein
MNSGASGSLRFLPLTLGLVAVACDRSDRGDEPVTGAYQLENDPITIAVSTVGRFGDGQSWYLSVNSSGQAQLTIETFPEPTHREFHVPADRMKDLRQALLTEQFFDLKDEYGELVPDGSTDTITVIAGDEAKSVKLHFLGNWVNHEDVKVRDKLREPARAIRVLLLIRDWFDDAEAVDLRRYDRRVVEVAESLD